MNESNVIIIDLISGQGSSESGQNFSYKFCNIFHIIDKEKKEIFCQQLVEQQVQRKGERRKRVESPQQNS